MTEGSHWSARLAALEACPEGVDFGRTQADALAGWNDCRRGDWMLWFLARGAQTVLERRRVLSAAGQILSTLCDLFPPRRREDLVVLLRRCEEIETPSLLPLPVGTRRLALELTARGDLAAAASCEGLVCLIRLARMAAIADRSEADHLRWTRAATRPAAFHALARSNAVLARGGSVDEARRAAHAAAKESADLLRRIIPPDTLPLFLYASL